MFNIRRFAGGVEELILNFFPGTRFACIALTTALAGCSALPKQQLAGDEQPVITGSAARSNQTPLEPAFACLAGVIRESKATPRLGITVGDVKDYTGKYSQNEGSTITQGGALMIYSALGKLGDVVQVQERFDTRIAELELAYTDRRQLGDGQAHSVEAGKPAVPWVPYFGGSILRSNYYIVGGITELNYNIGSGGLEAGVSNIGVRYRTFTMNVGVDLRIVDTRTLVVVKTVSLQKQIVGEEVGAGIFRFFGDSLLDVNVGSKNQEPLQLGVRTTIEHGVLELVAAVARVDAAQCLTAKSRSQHASPAAVATTVSSAPASTRPGKTLNSASANDGADRTPGASEDNPAGLTAQNAVASPQGGQLAIEFDFGSSSISAQGMTAIDKMANDAQQGAAMGIQLLARDSETWPPAQRRELAEKRAKAVADAMVARGVKPSRITVTWMASATEASITRHGAGQQLVATLAIGR